jgi:hypothetical protein
MLYLLQYSDLEQGKISERKLNRDKPRVDLELVWS